MPSIQSRVEREEQLLEAYRKERYQGSARVLLDYLSFDHGFSHCMGDGRNSIRLERILEIQGCLRINRDYHVPVLVSAADWGRRVRFNETDSGPFRALDVPLDTVLRAVKHESLISAARKWLSPPNRWWVVDVYVEAPGPEHGGAEADQPAPGQLQARLVQSLQEQFRNERQPPDGLIYYKIRLYEGALDQPADQAAANKWWAILQNNPATKKHKYLRAFLRHGSFPQAFDALLPVPGLWAVLSYLEHIRHTFITRIFGGEMALAAGADAKSVQLLQCRAPKISNGDLHFLQKRMNDGTLFPLIQDGTKREALWNRLQTIDVPIPTLQTFFSDLRYLAVARRAMRALLHITSPHTKMSIDERLGGQHRMIGHLPLDDGKRVVRRGLRELWRFSFQYGLKMTGTARRQPRDRRTQEAASVVPDVTAPVDRTRLWQHFFWLADGEGFNIPSLGDFGERPMDPAGVPTPANSPEAWSEEEPVSRRRGIPFTPTIDADRCGLSKEALEQTWELRSVTPTLIRHFFRHLSEDIRGSPTTRHPESRVSTPPRQRAVEFLDGLSARGFVLEIGRRRGAQGADIYEWHLEHPLDEVQATLSPGFVSEYEVPPENQLKRRRRDQEASGAKKAMDEIMAWIDRQRNPSSTRDCTAIIGRIPATRLFSCLVPIRGTSTNPMRGKERPRTIWADPARTSAPPANDRSKPSVRLGKRANAAQGASRPVHSQSPWEHYEAGAEVFCGRDVTLARHRTHRKGVVHLQRLTVDRQSAESRIRIIDQCQHPTFPHSLGRIIRPVGDLSVSLCSCSPRWQVLEGIRFLQNQGLVLAALGPTTVLLTADGHVKIGVEDSCAIPKEDMHADTLKLTALAALVEQLMDHVVATMKKWKEPHSRGPEIRSVLAALRTEPLDDLLKVRSVPLPKRHPHTVLISAPESIPRLAADRGPAMAGDRRQQESAS
ncbi:predicted protein [Aspergillus terreus NIH2624]|uniref:Uncharacterized protein n=1 Tax=Aspergillus terreus (strain NIH 2624 / FGSC A1156) TaxID=341663 RepID=Q0C8P9_ASPTN|nr:uncharacterized protein ATEG_09935 [Aspergillus terreus NIH2624]EAU30126.1 predicted protein [Aspergillus terreus NIH2624]